MTYKTHFNFGILLTLLMLINSYNITHLELTSNLIIFLFIGGIVALIPDADCNKSKINKFISITGYIMILAYLVIFQKMYILTASLIWAILTKITKHRTFSHSAIGVIIFCLPFWGTVYLFPVCVGYCSHLISDMLTNRGIPILYPLKGSDGKYIKACVGLITTGSMAENFIRILLIGSNIFLLYKMLF